MNQADEQYKRVVETVMRVGVKDTDQHVRTVWEDGTPAYTKSIFGHQVEFDEGELPILTTKRVYWKTALKEILIFWQKQSVEEKDFKDANVKVWQEWFNKDGNLGRSYAYQFESHRHHKREIVKIKPIIKDVEDGKISKPFIGEIDKSCDDCVYESNNSGKFIVLNKFKNGTHFDNQQSYEIQFLDTGYRKLVRKYDAIKGEVKDPFHRSIRGVGYLGKYKSVKNYSDDEIKKLRVMWENMITRCYSSDPHGRYMNNGIFVDNWWHSFENFLRDIRYLPQFILARESGFNDWSIDKDYYGSNCYSKDTCVWLIRNENYIYRNNNKPFYMIDGNGLRTTYLSIRDCVRDLELVNGSGISGCLNKYEHRKTVKGFKFEYIDDNEYLYRYELSRNQVVELLNNINSNPSSRRLMSSFWNYADVDKKQLQECAWSTNWNVRDGKLDLILIQRSVDVGLGLVFNWFQYYMLLSMIAHVSNLKVGRFIHQMGNVHYYDRHEENLIEQISRQSYETPKLWINENVKDFFDFTEDDLKLIDYQHGGKIDFEVAI
jgi:thymidylate synthase